MEEFYICIKLCIGVYICSVCVNSQASSYCILLYFVKTHFSREDTQKLQESCLTSLQSRLLSVVYSISFVLEFLFICL